MKIVLSTSEFVAAVQVALSAKRVLHQIQTENVKINCHMPKSRGRLMLEATEVDIVVEIEEKT